MTCCKVFLPYELSLVSELAAETKCSCEIVVRCLLYDTLLTSVGKVGIYIRRRSNFLAIRDCSLRSIGLTSDFALPVSILIAVILSCVVIPVRVEITVDDLVCGIVVVPILHELIKIHDIQILLNCRNTKAHLDCDSRL